MSESETETEKKERLIARREADTKIEMERIEEELKKPEASAQPCPVYPASIEKILATLDQLDKGEIDEFDAVQQVAGVMKEHRKVKLEALKKLEQTETEQEEESETATTE